MLVAEDLARADTERVYKAQGWDKAGELDLSKRTVSSGNEYSADDWKVPTGTAEPVDRRHKWQHSQDS